MKILELTNYSKGICGVWERVKQESQMLDKKGHNIVVMSSNAVKGEISSLEDEIGKIRIMRFPFKKLGGESFMYWFNKNAFDEALNFKPDIVIANSYRHLHTTSALKLKQILGCKVFLVTHAPFDRQRGLLNNLIVKFYDIFIGKRTLNKFDRVIAITRWEMPYLLKLGAKKSEISYIPNGLPKEFFTLKKCKEKNNILFLGRISPIKNVEILIKAFSKIEDKKAILEIVGPAEIKYKEKLEELVNSLALNNRVIFLPPIYNLKEKIEKIDSARIFVLPSKSEGMPQSLIEAMARGKIVVASDNKGSLDIIEDGKNGYLFKNNDVADLTSKLNFIINGKKGNNSKIKKNSEQYAKKLSLDNLIMDLEDLF